MIKIIRARDRRYSDFCWLKTHWLFSFSDYYDPDNIQFGALRVFNDDIVAPGTGFPTHPHREMEIVTIVLDGEMTHADSMGNETVIRAGDVQRMSAGTGLTHSEFNLAGKDVHFYQIWIYPDRAGLKPSYDQRSFADVPRENRILPVASGQGIPDTVTFHTDATIYTGDFRQGHAATFDPGDNRRVFLYVTEGRLGVEDAELGRGDQARIEPTHPLALEALGDTRFVLIDVPSCKGWGYDKATLRGAKR